MLECLYTMDIFQALILGLVEGITEFLPISSTAHLILTANLLNLKETEFLKSFEIVVQLGAILSVVLLYWRSFLNWEIMKRLVVGSLPVGILGLALYKVVKLYLMGNVMVVLWALLLGGILILLFERFHTEKSNAIEEITALTYKQSFLVGCFQIFALVPGVSRSGATVIGGLLLGLSRKTIVEFSFLLAVPVMVAASALDLYKNADAFSMDQFWVLAVGFGMAFLTALAAIRFLLAYIRRRSFAAFGVYRIVLALLFFAIVGIGG